jgi:hypothetical protein
MVAEGRNDECGGEALRQPLLAAIPMAAWGAKRNGAHVCASRRYALLTDTATGRDRLRRERGAPGAADPIVLSPNHDCWRRAGYSPSASWPLQ